MQSSSYREEYMILLQHEQAVKAPDFPKIKGLLSKCTFSQKIKHGERAKERAKKDKEERKLVTDFNLYLL